MEDSEDLILVLYSGKFLCIISVKLQLPNCKIELILLCIFRALCKILKCYHAKENTLSRSVFLFLTGTVVNQIIQESAYYLAGAKLFFSFDRPSEKGRNFGFHLLYYGTKEMHHFLYPNLLKQPPGISVCLKSKLHCP